MSGITLLFGDTGTRKTSLALSAPGTKWFAEFDPGSYDRAAAGMPEFEEGEVELHHYETPTTHLESPGRVLVGQKGGVENFAAHRLEGWQECFWGFVQDFSQALKKVDGKVPYDNYIWDTGTRLWLACRQAWFEQVQDKLQQDTTKEERERLGQLQYTEPNSRINGLTEWIINAGSNLIIVAHAGDVYQGGEPAKGKIKADGYKELANISNVVLHMANRGGRLIGTVVKIDGLSLADGDGTYNFNNRGMEIEAPTMTKLEELRKAILLINRKGGQVPSTYEAVLETAEFARS